MGIVIYSADVYYYKVFLEILPKHKESPIFIIIESHLQLFFRTYLRPKLFVFFTGSSFPF